MTAVAAARLLLGTAWRFGRLETIGGPCQRAPPHRPWSAARPAAAQRSFSTTAAARAATELPSSTNDAAVKGTLRAGPAALGGPNLTFFMVAATERA